MWSRFSAGLRASLGGPSRAGQCAAPCASCDRSCMMDASANKMPLSVFALSRFACVEPRGRQAE
jgi:hypothetical protein